MIILYGSIGPICSHRGWPQLCRRSGTAPHPKSAAQGTQIDDVGLKDRGELPRVWGRGQSQASHCPFIALPLLMDTSYPVDPSAGHSLLQAMVLLPLTLLSAPRVVLAAGF